MTNCVRIIQINLFLFRMGCEYRSENILDINPFCIQKNHVYLESVCVCAMLPCYAPKDLNTNKIHIYMDLMYTTMRCRRIQKLKTSIQKGGAQAWLFRYLYALDVLRCDSAWNSIAYQWRDIYLACNVGWTLTGNFSKNSNKRNKFVCICLRKDLALSVCSTMQMYFVCVGNWWC